MRGPLGRSTVPTCIWSGALPPETRLLVVHALSVVLRVTSKQNHLRVLRPPDLSSDGLPGRGRISQGSRSSEGVVWGRISFERNDSLTRRNRPDSRFQVSLVCVYRSLS